MYLCIGLPTVAQVYAGYELQLVKCLPMNDQLFITELSANSLLPGNMEATITSLLTPVNKSSHFLSNIIKPALDIDYTDSFDKLLVIMEGCGYPHVQALAVEIKTEITKSQKYVCENTYVCDAVNKCFCKLPKHIS